MAKISLMVNGRRRGVEADPDAPLLYILRNDLGLYAAKFGCGLGQCGACTVIVGGRAVRSCVTRVSAAARLPITTLEGLGSPERPHPVQAAFIEEQAAQCGYCVNGMVMAAKSLLDRNPRPTESQVKNGLAGILCRCGTHSRIVSAVLKAAKASGKRA
jgi:nicotinate dehydrogenase subunit A